MGVMSSSPASAREPGLPALEMIHFDATDGLKLTGDIIDPGGATKAVVFGPALGVPRRLYHPLMRYLATRGYACLVFDYRGTGDSTLTRELSADVHLTHWAERDLEAALLEAERRFSPERLALVGHSISGQILGLAPSSERLKAVILVGSTVARPALYPYPFRLGLWLLWSVIIPLSCRGAGWFPARRLGMSSVDVPKQIMGWWARWARGSDYLFSPEFGLDTSRYQRLSSPLLAVDLSDDSYAPQRPVDALTDHFTAARTERMHVHVPGLGVGPVGHFGFFRDRVRDALWRPVVDWLDAQS